MKKYMRYGLIGVLFFLSLIQTEAQTLPSPSIFPVSTGITGKVRGTQINLRQFPDTQARVTGYITQDEVKVIGQNNEWYNVKIGSRKGWIHKKYLEVARTDLVPYAKVLGEEIVDYGLQFIGTPYVWGGSNLQKGVDCSGFTQEVYKAFGVEISRVSYMQAEDGMTVSKQQLRTGDLVFFDTQGKNNGNISHVGIYMDDNQFIHSDGTNGVMVSNLNSPYYTRNYVKGVRILGE